MSIDTLLDKWHGLKEKMAKMSKDEELIRKKIQKVMEKNEEKILNTSQYTVKRSVRSRETVSKKSLPSDIWDKYKNRITYTVMTIEPNDEEPND